MENNIKPVYKKIRKKVKKWWKEIGENNRIFIRIIFIFASFFLGFGTMVTHPAFGPNGGSYRGYSVIDNQKYYFYYYDNSYSSSNYKAYTYTWPFYHKRYNVKASSEKDVIDKTKILIEEFNNSGMKH